MPEDVLVFGGCFSDTQKKILRAGRICFYDFMDDEQVKEENAVATAEGVIAELVSNSPYNIEGAKILVTGYGKCGRAAACRLKSLGARVTVLARRKETRREAKKDGIYAADFALALRKRWGLRWWSTRYRHRICDEASDQRTSTRCLYLRYCICTGWHGLCLRKGIWNPGRACPGASGEVCTEGECSYSGSVYGTGDEGAVKRYRLEEASSVLHGRFLCHSGKGCRKD